MGKIKIGYQAVFFAGEGETGRNPVRDTYEEALNDIESESDSVKKYNVNTFTHAKIEKNYYKQY